MIKQVPLKKVNSKYANSLVHLLFREVVIQPEPKSLTVTNIVQKNYNVMMASRVLGL